MMSIETKINGKLINYIHILNVKSFSNGFDFYNIEYFRPEKNPNFLKFSVRHKRDDGAEKLALIIYKKVNKLLEKK